MLERLIGALLLERHEKWQLETRPLPQHAKG